jgi:2-amino-4-hydroxy-6-hydroxymethyldihydropteridine diphosphokinase
VDRIVVAVAIGSNLGDRAAHLSFARDRLSRLLTDLRVSSPLETEPVGVPGPQPAFVNAAAVGATDASASDLLSALLRIERDRGRERPFPGAARTLDLDLILYGDRIINDPDVVVPHPRFRERLFVLKPLGEIAPDLRDPVTGKRVADLLKSLVR